ncbi:MAG: Thiamine pyrophosphate TPP-binding protein [Mucilaginibacter sp.]|nr:Thiamine pyrophosphate TPP-binding protein [Mucilaginibacter sp.]
MGDSLNGITDELCKSTKIKWIHYRHEEAAAFAAETTRSRRENCPCMPEVAARNTHLITLTFISFSTLKKQNDIDEVKGHSQCDQWN